jgi:outer membrane protein OmpA-like peptidoglycan-associated protein
MVDFSGSRQATLPTIVLFYLQFYSAGTGDSPLPFSPAADFVQSFLSFRYFWLPMPLLLLLSLLRRFPAHLLGALLLCGLTIPTSWAQGWIGLANSNYAGTNGLYQNPSSIADSRQKFFINLSGADVNFYNTYLEVKTPYTPWQLLRNNVGDEYRDVNGNVQFKPEYLTEMLDGRTKFVTASGEVRLPSFMVALGPTRALAFSSRVRGFAQASNVSEPLARLIRYSLDDAQRLGLANQVLSDNGFNLSVNAYHEFALSYAQNFTDNTVHFLKGGLTLKYLAGLGSAYVNNKGVSYQVYNGDSIEVRDRNVTYGSTDYRYYQRDDFKVTDLYGSQRLGWGFGGDLGLTYEWRPDADKYSYKMDGESWVDHTQNKYKLKVGLALVDLGGIVYDNPNYVRQAGMGSAGTVQWGSLDTIQYRQLAGIDELMQRTMRLNVQTKSFTSVLPAALHLNADYRFREHFYLGAAWTQNLLPTSTTGSRAISSLALTPRAEFSQAEVAFPVILANDYRKVQLGAMLRLGPLTVGSDNLGGVFGAGAITGYDLYASVGFGLSKTKHQDRDHDQVSDKLDKCPTVAGVWEFRGCPDRDGDHVPDKADACPDTPGLAKLQGCPDRDGDGIKDSEDRCPHLAGPAEFQGCPDTDGDKVPDKDDHCPDEAGLAKLQGCPDRDGDGIKDSEDQCPDTPGLPEHGGCPDTDGDGVYDHHDSCPAVAGPLDNKGCPYVDTDHDSVFDHHDGCPTVFGPAENKGCPYPDSDADGVADNQDECPKTPGPASNKGCPVLKKAEIKIINTAFANLEFETGKDVIRLKSYPSLNALAKLLVEHPTFILRLSGHTDNVGKPKANLLLSQKRTEAVQAYLLKHNVPNGQVVAEWFGQAKPKASNKTAAGRARNRRVEMKVLFE